MSGLQVLVARPLPGTVGERRRVCHVVFLTERAGIPAVLRTNCGAEFGYGEVELLAEAVGMPCGACLCRVPAPGEGDTRASS